MPRRIFPSVRGFRDAGRAQLIACLALAAVAPEPASANNYAESLGWQFASPADRMALAASLDLLERRRGGVYAAPVYTTNVERQYNCSIGATATGNANSQSALANSPSITGAVSTATGNNSSNQPGSGTVSNGQANSGSVHSGVTGGTTAQVQGSARQALNASQTNSGNQQASVTGSNACLFGALN